ncbi:hypothetical protein [Streptomyces sp. NPDC007172]|uniref:hypothetical protein n=1 Tax=unclassified Streptomyces TaxID=2593676 RepID=UPI0036B4AE7A
MILVTMLILVAVFAPLTVLALAPKAPARRNPLPRGRFARRRLPVVPPQPGGRRHAR